MNTVPLLVAHAQDDKSYAGESVSTVNLFYTLSLLAEDVKKKILLITQHYCIFQPQITVLCDAVILSLLVEIASSLK